MGLVKIIHQRSGNSSHSRHGSYSPNVDGLGGDESSVSGDDSDYCELAKVGYELGMVEGQLCRIPYELYDLPDLEEILSLETWNLCLTEEERFFLSAYLPDMDQQTFSLTMMELLAGNDIFFGSPLAEFFKRLKGGFYPQLVSCFREGLQFLQRRVYYHSLRLYHESMVRTFSGMMKVWKQCQPSISVEERVHIWKAPENHKESMNLFDVFAYPKDENLLNNKVSTRTITCPFSERAEYINGKGHNFPSPDLNGMKLVALNTSAKGVLKIKSSSMNSFQACIPKAAPSDMWPPCRPPAKGVLKIIPKGPISNQQEKPPRVMPMQSELIETPGLQTSRLSHLPQHIYRWDARDYHEEPPLQPQKVGDVKAYRSTELPDCIMNQQRVEFMNSATRPSRNFQSPIRYVKQAKDPLFDVRTDLQEHNLFESGSGTWNKVETSPKGDGSSRNRLKVRINSCASDNVWQNLDQETREPSKISLEAYPFAAEYYQGEQHMASMQKKHIATYPKVTGVVSRIIDVDIGKHEMFTAHLDQVRRHKDVNNGGSEKLHHQPEVLEGQQDGLVLPRTYKRRKAQAKLNSLDFSMRQAMDTEVVSRILDVGIGKHEMFTAHLDQVRRRKDVNNGGSEKLHHQPEVLEGQQDGLVLSKTYKRRKAQAKLNSVDFSMAQAMDADFKFSAPQEANHPGDSLKIIRI